MKNLNLTYSHLTLTSFVREGNPIATSPILLNEVLEFDVLRGPRALLHIGLRIALSPTHPTLSPRDQMLRELDEEEKGTRQTQNSRLEK